MSTPQISIEKVEQELLHNGFRDNFEQSLKTAIELHHIDIKRKVSDREIRYMQMHLKGELDYDDLQLAIDHFGEKVTCNIFCSGNLAELYSLKTDLKAIKDDLIEAEKGASNVYVSKEKGKELQDPVSGNYAPAHSLHINNGLGENASSWAGKFNTGYVWRLFSDGYIRDITADMVKQLFMDRYDILPSDLEAERTALLMNKERRIFEGQMLQGEIGDSATTKNAISMITNEGKKLGLSYEKTDKMGREARQSCSKFDHEAGKIIAKAKIDGDSPELEQRTARFFKNFMESINMNASNCVALLTKMNSRKN